MTSHRIPQAQDVLLGEHPRLVLSPHLDDALLSAFAVVSAGPGEVWTTFAGRPEPAQTTSWDLSCGFPDSDATMTARLAEDEAAFAGLTVTVRRFGALDGAYTTPGQRRHDLAMIADALDIWLRDHPTGLVLAPAGAGLEVPLAWWQRAMSVIQARRSAKSGQTEQKSAPVTPQSSSTFPGSSATEMPSYDAVGTHTAPTARKLAIDACTRCAQGLIQQIQRAMHADAQRRRMRVVGKDGLAANPDHLDLRELAWEIIARHPDAVFALYEDLPYLWHAPADAAVARWAKKHRSNTGLVTLPVDQSTKHKRLAHYASQMPVMDQAGRLMRAETLPPRERYWLVLKR